MRLRAPRFPGVVLGSGASLVCCALSGVLFFRLLEMPVSFITFIVGSLAVVLLGLAATFGYWTYGLVSLAYQVDRDQLAIRWGPVLETVPLSSVERLVPGESVPPAQAVRGINWPGYHVGHGEVEGLGEVAFFSAHRRPRDLVYVVTPTLTYGISVGDAEAFAREVARWRRLGPIQQVPQQARLGAWMAAPFWFDRSVLRLLGAAIVLNLVLLAATFYFYSLLPELLAIKVSLVGDVSQIGRREEVLYLPLSGLAVLVLNAGLAFGLHRFERAAALLCLGVGVFIQLLLASLAFGLLL